MGSIKKVIGTAVVGLIGALALAPSAGAVEAPTPPGPCVFNIAPEASTTFPVNVTVSGTAPVGVQVTVYLDGVATAGPSVVPASGQFVFNNVIVPLSTTAITVNYTFGEQNAYTSQCTDVGGSVVIRVRAAAAALAFTGSSSNTSTYVLVGFAAVALGLVMVVGVRRRASVRG